MTKRYKELLDIITKFPFLKDTVKDNIKEVYSNKEFLNYKEFIKDYDYKTDLFNYIAEKPRYNRGGYYSYSYRDSFNRLPFTANEDILLFNLIANSDTRSIYEANYPRLVEICNVLITNLNIDETWAKNYHYFDTSDELPTEDEKLIQNKIKAVGYIASEFAFDDAFETYVRSQTGGKSKFIADILEENPTSKQLEKLCKVLNLKSRGYDICSYSVANKGNAYNLINAAVAKVYDSYTLEDIELFKTKAKNVSNIFNYFGVQVDREATLLNNHISDSDRSELTKNFTSADDIAELTKNVINAFSAEGSFDGDKVNQIIANVIVGNKKIRDKDFPTTKNKVVHEFLRLLFIANSKSSDFTGKDKYAAEIKTVVNNNLDYVLDPYFITNLLMKESVLSDYYTDLVRNTKKFIKFVFDDQAKVNKFITNYINELSKPEKDRVSTVKGVKPRIISYGVLRDIVEDYCSGKTGAFTGIEEDGSANPVKLLFYTYLKHKDHIRKDLIEVTGNKETSSYYYGDDDSSQIGKLIQAILNSGGNSYNTARIGIDGVERSLSRIDRLYHGSFNHIMSYLTESDSDFDYNENFSVGVREGSGYYSYSKNKEAKYAPKKYYEYNRTAIKVILIQLYKYIAQDFGTVLNQEQLDAVKAFITSKDSTITLLPDTTFAIYSQNGRNSLNKEYSSDVTEYGCLNYITLPALGVYLVSMRDGGNMFTFKLTDDCVLVPELCGKYYEDSYGKKVNSKAKNIMDLFNSLTKDEMEMLKPLFFDNFGDQFAFARTMQACIFANMLNEQDKDSSYRYRAYSSYLVDAYSLQSDLAKPSTIRAIDYIQVFFVNVLYPRMRDMNLITNEEIHTVEETFNNAYTDYECLLSLR